MEQQCKDLAERRDSYYAMLREQSVLKGIVYNLQYRDNIAPKSIRQHENGLEKLDAWLHSEGIALGLITVQ